MENAHGHMVLPPRDRLTRRHLAAVTGALVIFCILARGAANANEMLEPFKESGASPRRTVDHSAWDRLLKAYVKPGADGVNRVDYTAFKRGGREPLNAYIAQLESIDPATLDRPQRFAFFANLYNAKTVEIVLENYPVKSIKDISLGGALLALVGGGPWKAKVLRVKGVELSLDDVEHEILRPLFKDPRVHYAINCASISCPNLQVEAFTGAKLDVQLDAAARAYVNHPRGVSIGPNGAIASSIYGWFKEDFGGGDASVLAHLRTYAAPALAEKLETIHSIAGYSYDWGLNDVAH
jgi:hypothetical protein